MLIPPDDAEQLKELLEKELDQDVQITVLNEPAGGPLIAGRKNKASGEVGDLMSELAELSAKLQVETIDARRAPERMNEYAVGGLPAIVFELGGRRNVRFFGFPSGYEFSSLLQTIVQVSKGQTGLPPQFIKDIEALPGPLHLQVFVTPT